MGVSIMGYLHYWPSTMNFSARVIALRKQRNLSARKLVAQRAPAKEQESKR